MNKNKYLATEGVQTRLDFVEELLLLKVPNIRALPMYLEWCSEYTGSGAVTGSRQLFIKDTDRVFQRNHKNRLGKRERHEMSKRTWILNELDYNQYRNYENGQSSAVLGAIRTAAEIEKLLDTDKAGQVTINFNLKLPDNSNISGSIKDLVNG